MKQLKLLLFLVLLNSLGAWGQTLKTRSDATFTQADTYLVALKTLGVPFGPTNTLNSGLARTGQLFFNTGDNQLYVYNATTSSWITAITPATTTFSSDVVLNIGSGGKLGKYSNGQTIPAAGKTMQEFLYDIATATIAPTYTAPTAGISGSPGPGTYEIGTVLNLTFSSSYTQNNGGAVNSTTYRKGGTPLASNTDNITLTTSVSYDVQKGYDQGACLNNNLGVPDCTGRINAGTATSGIITYTPSPKRYWGYTSNTAANNADILAAAGGGSELSSSKSKTFTVTASGSNRPFFSYVSSSGDLTSINIGGLESLGAYTKTVVSVTNAQGYTQNYNVYTQNNATSGNVTATAQ